MNGSKRERKLDLRNQEAKTIRSWLTRNTLNPPSQQILVLVKIDEGSS